MWKAEIEVTLVSDDESEEERELRFEIEEEVSNGVADVEQWEGDIRRIGLRTMRELFESGMRLLEQRALSVVDYGRPERL